MSEPCSGEQSSKMSNSSATINIDRVAAMTAASKKIDNFKGCDWLHEISITIRRTCRTNIPNER
jgi:hypothetical protein